MIFRRTLAITAKLVFSLFLAVRYFVGKRRKKDENERKIDLEKKL